MAGPITNALLSDRHRKLAKQFAFFTTPNDYLSL
jgi:hypothetical protein